jgi:hypothetical protein
LKEIKKVAAGFEPTTGKEILESCHSTTCTDINIFFERDSPDSNITILASAELLIEELAD